MRPSGKNTLFFFSFPEPIAIVVFTRDLRQYDETTKGCDDGDVR